MVDQETLRQWASWGQTIPTFIPSILVRLSQALEDLKTAGAAKFNRWQALRPRLDSLVTVLYPTVTTGGIGWLLPAWEANLALCILNFPPEWTDAQMLECAIGKETFYPEDERTLENNFTFAKQLNDAVDAGTAFGRVPPGV